MAQYTGIVLNTITNHYIVSGAEAETPEAAKTAMEGHLQNFCRVEKVITHEKFEQVKKRNPGKRLPDYYHLL